MFAPKRCSEAVAGSDIRGTGAGLRVAHPANDVRTAHVAIVAVALLLFLRIRDVVAPLVMADEAGYLVWSARIAMPWRQVLPADYYPAYGAMLAWTQLLGDSFDTRWSGVQVTNVALWASTVIVLARLIASWNGRSVVSTTDMLIALVAGSYAPALSMTALAMSENLLHLMVPAALVSYYRVWRERRLFDVGLHLAIVGAAVLAHPRMIALIPIAAAALLRTDLPRAIRPALVGALGLGSAFALADRDFRALRVLRRLLSDGDVALTFLGTLSGHLLAAFVSAFGLSFVGAIVIVLRARERRAERAVLAVLVLALAISAGFLLGGTGSHAVYTRYLDPFQPVLILIGLDALRRRAVRVRHLAVAALILGLTVIPFASVGGFFGRTTSREAIFGVRYLIDMLGYAQPMAFAVPAFVGLIVIGMTVVVPSRWALAIVAGLFALASLTVAESNIRLLVRDSQSRTLESVNAVMIESLLPTREVTCVSIDRRNASQWHRYNYRARLVRLDVREYMSGRGDPPCGPLVLSSSPSMAQVEGVRLLSLAPHSGFALWVLPGALQDELASMDLLFPAGFNGRYPEEALAASIELVSARRFDGELLIDFAVTNKGPGAPWPGHATLFGMKYPVRAVVSIVDADGSVVGGPARTNLPSVVRPGATVPLSATVVVGLEEPGLQIRIEMVQDGNHWFGGALMFSVEEALSFGTPATIGEAARFAAPQPTVGFVLGSAWSAPQSEFTRSESPESFLGGEVLPGLSRSLRGAG